MGGGTKDSLAPRGDTVATGAPNSCIFNQGSSIQNLPSFFSSLFLYLNSSPLCCLGKPAAPCACCMALPPGQTPHFVLTLLPQEFHCPHFPYSPIQSLISLHKYRRGISRCFWHQQKDFPGHMEELSRKTDMSMLGCSEQTHREALNALAELVCQERTIHGEGRLFYSILFHFIYVCARPDPAWMPEPRAGTGGQAGEGSGAATNSHPRWQTCHCGSSALRHRHRQQGGRREGRKELWKTKVVLWTAIMDI